MSGSLRTGLLLPLLSCLTWSCGFYFATLALDGSHRWAWDIHFEVMPLGMTWPRSSIITRSENECEDDRITLEPPSPIIIAELGTINVTCQAIVLNGTAGYEWRKLGDSEFSMPGQHLYMSQILTSQAGEYECHVTVWGQWSASASVQVIVEYFPRWVPELPQKFAGDIGEQVSLTCSVRAYPAVTFSWVFGTTTLSQNVRNTDYVSMYTVDNIQQEDYGTYTCLASNSAGENTFQLELQPPGIPDPPFSCDVLNVSNAGAVMACIPGYAGGASISFEVQKMGTLVETKFVPTTTTWEDQLAIVSCEGLYPNVSYTLGVFGANIYGRSTESLAVNIRTLDIPLPIPLPVKDDLPLIAIIGGAVGGFVVIVIIIVISIVCTSHRKSKKSPPSTPTSSIDPALSGRPSPTGTVETEVDENRFNRERERASMRGVTNYDFDEGGFNSQQLGAFKREPHRKSKRSSMGKGNRNSFGKGGWLRRSFGRQPQPNYYDTDYGGTSYEEFEKRERTGGDGMPYAIRLQGFDTGETSDFAYNNTAYNRSQENLGKPSRPNTRPPSQYSSSQGSRPTSHFIPTDIEAVQNAESMRSHQPSLAGMGALASFPILNPISGQETPRSPSRYSSRPSLSPSNESVNRRPDRPPLTGHGQQDFMRHSPHNVQAVPKTPISPTPPTPPFDPFVLNLRNLNASPQYSSSEQSSTDRQLEPFIQKPSQKISPFSASTENMGKPTAHVNPLTKSRERSASSYSLSDEFWEFPREKLYIRQKIGDGVMGEVWRARAEGICGREGQTVVAVKTLKEDYNEEERRSILRELRVMKSLQPHPNIIALLGCCTKQDPPYIIMEYAARGTLQKLLRSYRLPWTAEPAEKYSPYANLPPVRKLTSRDLIIFAIQISDGMDYISSKDLLHRDLAARNILVDEEYICKVSDFGFARDVAQSRQYESRTQNRLPLRWMAPEALFDCMYTTKTDIWSFGVLLWEMVTLGSSPYPGITGPEVMELLQEGFRMEKPHLCSEPLYMVMRDCWQSDPRHRPTFQELRQRFDLMLQHGTQAEFFVDQMRDNFYEIFEDLPGEKC